jgi:hypothetical protein
MSRGLGSVQVGLLAIIQQQDKPLDTYDLARRFYHSGAEGPCMLSAAQIKATYRALCSLHKRGKIVRTEGRGSGGFVWWMTHEQFIAETAMTAAFRAQFAPTGNNETEL